MPAFDYNQVKFLGASVRNARASIGWNGQTSQLTVGTVEDDGDAYLATLPGSLVSFSLGNFVFRGLVQKYVSTRGLDGNPIQETIVVDPTEILAGAKVILGGYSGVIAPAQNLLNVFGFWENLLGFGGSLINETGMLWSLVRSAI